MDAEWWISDGVRVSRYSEGYKKAGEALFEKRYRLRSDDGGILAAKGVNYGGENSYPDVSPYNLTHRPPGSDCRAWGGSAALTCLGF